VWRNIRQIIDFPNKCIGVYTAIFIIIWLCAWILNGIGNTHFNLSEFRDTYVWLMTQLNITHAINSIWNSPKGTCPDNLGIKVSMTGKSKDN
jgi:hypothetical protein